MSVSRRSTSFEAFIALNAAALLSSACGAPSETAPPAPRTYTVECTPLSSPGNRATLVRPDGEVVSYSADFCDASFKDDDGQFGAFIGLTIPGTGGNARLVMSVGVRVVDEWSGGTMPTISPDEWDTGEGNGFVMLVMDAVDPSDETSWIFYGSRPGDQANFSAFDVPFQRMTHDQLDAVLGRKLNVIGSFDGLKMLSELGELGTASGSIALQLEAKIVAEASGAGGGGGGSCNQAACDAYANECQNNEVSQAPCYCAAACLCACSNDPCESDNLANASALGTTCSY